MTGLLLAVGFATAPVALAGQIVYQHGNDLWVMNDNGGGQHALITAAQAGATALSQPSLNPAGDQLSFAGHTPAPDTLCETNCGSLYSLVGGKLLDLSGAPEDCNTPGFECSSEAAGPATTVSGRVVYWENSAGGDIGGGAVSNTLYDRALNGSDQPAQWGLPTPSNANAPSKPDEFVEAADPVNANLIAYPGIGTCVNTGQPNCNTQIVVDDVAAQSPYVVSYDDVAQQALAFSPDAKYIVDFELGNSPGIWVYTNEDFNNSANASTWHGWWVLNDPLQDPSMEYFSPAVATIHALAITADGRIVFDDGTNIFELPASCYGNTSEGETTSTNTSTPTCGTIGDPLNPAADPSIHQLTTDGTGIAPDINPTWTADTTPVASIAPSHTRITKARISSSKHTASFSFSALTATGFRCELLPPTKKGHKKPTVRFASCASPKGYRHLRPGKYMFKVEGINSAGADPNPATKAFKIS